MKTTIKIILLNAFLCFFLLLPTDSFSQVVDSENKLSLTLSD